MRWDLHNRYVVFSRPDDNGGGDPPPPPPPGGGPGEGGGGIAPTDPKEDG